MRSRVGIILPERNAFDFTERPRDIVEAKMDRRNNIESGKVKL